MYGGTPSEVDRCQESRGSRWVASGVTVGIGAAAGSVGRQSEGPAVKISQCISRRSAEETAYMQL